MKYQTFRQLLPAAAVLIQYFGTGAVLGQSNAPVKLTPAQQSRISLQVSLPSAQTVL
jgi:hypothetical protein